MPVRVRFAPSPTGPLHIGGVRTALYNFLFARKHRGTFCIRIEDTDQNRFVPAAEEYIFESLSWLGIVADEGPLNGGPYAPYRQSERKEIYKDYVYRLVESGHAYYAFDTTAELEDARNKYKSSGPDVFQYGAKTRELMRNSVSLPPGEWEKLITGGVPFVIRLNVPADEEIRFNDEIRGEVTVGSSTIDDKVLMKSDGMPTYHLANVVDDHIMKITHVIRGEEWLPSAPAHCLLYRFFGWDETMPSFAHLPLLLKPEGSGKLSKRDAEKGGFPIFPINWKDPESGEISRGFRESGYLPEATVNFLALLGWNPGTQQEIFSMDELVEAFSIGKVNKSGAKFDIEKAKFFNQQYIKTRPIGTLREFLEMRLEENGTPYSPARIDKVIEALKDRVTFPDEFYTQSLYFFSQPGEFDMNVIQKKLTPDMASILKEISSGIRAMKVTSASGDFKELISAVMIKNGLQPGQAMQLIRVLVTGTTTGVDLMLTLEILGPGEVAERIDSALLKLTQ
ncbi:MAG TPA: glutamate--tRNA ligase [Cyclobacteriaceae bacterium]|nr:glutamate--tRNA ligase [Cyclobacteriaceae bacterium]